MVKSRGRLLLLLIVGWLPVLFLVAAAQRPIVSTIVTRLALRDAREALALETSWDRGRDACEQASRQYSWFFRHGYCDIPYLMRGLSPNLSRDSLPVWSVIITYYCDVAQSWDWTAESELPYKAQAEMMLWVKYLFASPEAKELLVSLLVNDYPTETGDNARDGLLKQALFSLLFRREVDDYRCSDTSEPAILASHRLVLASISEAEWQGVFGDLNHERERVRAGALLLLYHYPDTQHFIEEARRALADECYSVRMVAAGALALRGASDGEDELIAGLADGRWELRWWCAAALTEIGSARGRAAVELRVANGVESDSWLRGELPDMLRVWPEAASPKS